MVETPQTKDWKAYENRQPGPGGPTLLVMGKVKIASTSQKPVLTEATPQGTVGQDLVLDLTIEGKGAGTEPTEPWAEARFQKNVSKGQYTSVTIQSGGERIATAAVEPIE